MPDDILTKVDRASVAVSFEVRVPLFDHRAVERSWHLSRSQLAQGMEGKHILRWILHRHAPPELFERPKADFGIPLGDWLRGPPVEWANDLLSERSFCSSGPFNVPLIRWRLHEQMNGQRYWHAHVPDVAQEMG